jgi:hypothetical protein
MAVGIMNQQCVHSNTYEKETHSDHIVYDVSSAALRYKATVSSLRKRVDEMETKFDNLATAIRTRLVGSGLVSVRRRRNHELGDSEAAILERLQINPIDTLP